MCSEVCTAHKPQRQNILHTTSMRNLCEMKRFVVSCYSFRLISWHLLQTHRWGRWLDSHRSHRSDGGAGSQHIIIYSPMSPHSTPATSPLFGLTNQYSSGRPRHTLRTPPPTPLDNVSTPLRVWGPSQCESVTNSYTHH